MDKLAEIKKRLENVCKLRGNQLYDAKQELEQNAETDIEYLLSLLEEKDNALAFYADGNHYTTEYLGKGMTETRVRERGGIARKALNTSSNNEGE